jgi:hypothetical protein
VLVVLDANGGVFPVAVAHARPHAQAHRSASPRACAFSSSPSRRSVPLVPRFGPAMTQPGSSPPLSATKSGTAAGSLARAARDVAGADAQPVGLVDRTKCAERPARGLGLSPPGQGFSLPIAGFW